MKWTAIWGECSAPRRRLGKVVGGEERGGLSKKEGKKETFRFGGERSEKRGDARQNGS
jgi:hypothetical protein